MKLNKWLSLLLASAVAILAGPPATHAEAGLADTDSMPYVTLLDSFTLYSSSDTQPSEAIGRLSALQTVQLAPIETSKLFGIPTMEKIPVQTWLGPAWVNLKEGSYKYGRLDVKEETLTLLEEQTLLYDAPQKISSYALSPQKVQALASIPVCEPYTPCRTDDKWFLIRTSWLGEKWILPHHYAEKYKASPMEGMIPVAQESAVYLLPFEKPLENEPKIAPQVLKPIGKFAVYSMAGPSIWYQVETPQGLRWIFLNSSYGLGVEGVERADIRLDLPVPFPYYKTPDAYSAENSEQPPQALQALGKKNDWYFVLHDGTGKWVNPAKAIASRLTGDLNNDEKLGVRSNQVSLELTAASIALDIPYFDVSLTDRTLTFSPQTVLASREWTSPNGDTWYYIHTWQGAKWVRP